MPVVSTSPDVPPLVTIRDRTCSRGRRPASHRSSHPGLHDVDYRTKTFSCLACGSEAYFC